MKRIVLLVFLILLLTINTGYTQVIGGSTGGSGTGDVLADGTVPFTGSVTLDDGTTDSPSFIFKDSDDETFTCVKKQGASGSGYLQCTSAAGDGLQILVGNLRIGDGSPGQTINGEDVYINGLLEVDGVIYADGGVTGTVTGTASGNIPNTLADAAGDLIQGSADNTWAKLTKGAQGTLLQAGATVHAATTYAFPMTDGTENQILKVNASGDLVWAADADSAGTPAAITVADTTDTTSYVALFESATGDLGPKTDAGITYNAGTGVLTATGFAGPLTGNVTGNVSGTAGSLSGSALPTNSTVPTSIAIGADPADAGAIRLSNAGYIMSEADAAGTDISVIGVDSSEIIQIGASGASGVTITPNVIVTGTFSAGAAGFTVDADGDVTAKSVTVTPSATPSVVMKDSDNAAGTGGLFANSSGGVNDVIMSLGVEDSTGESTVYIEIDGVTETVDILKPLVLGTTGVRITSDNDGAITFLGESGGYDEDLTINLDDTENTAVISSSTGVTKINTGSIGLVSTGSFQGAVAINSDANGMTANEMTAVGLYNTMFFATGAGTWALPSAAAGMNFCVYSTTAAAIVINPDDSDDITLNGTQLADGDSITSASGAGDFICLIAIDAVHWYTMGRSGTWTDTN